MRPPPWRRHVCRCGPSTGTSATHRPGPRGSARPAPLGCGTPALRTEVRIHSSPLPGHTQSAPAEPGQDCGAAKVSVSSADALVLGQVTRTDEEVTWLALWTRELETSEKPLSTIQVIPTPAWPPRYSLTPGNRRASKFMKLLPRR